jgi:ABC-type proline/glycine betaine transport system permease subunit
MFGPLNGVRTALVIAAALAAIVSFVAGYPGAGLVLLAGVAVHGLGWLYLYVNRDRAANS